MDTRNLRECGWNSRTRGQSTEGVAFEVEGACLVLRDGLHPRALQSEHYLAQREFIAGVLPAAFMMLNKAAVASI